MTDNKRVEIKPAKGRPMLSWVGKKPLRDVIAYPAQLVETFAPEHAPKTDKKLWKDWTEKFQKGGLLFHGDNKDVLAHLLANGFRGKVKQVGRDIFHIDGRTADFTSATSMPEIPKGLTALWAAFLGWLGDRHFVLRIFKMLDDKALRKRRVSL